eukprot:1380307-Amorphochlora_amoeboformis.AAC.2
MVQQLPDDILAEGSLLRAKREHPVLAVVDMGCTQHGEKSLVVQSASADLSALPDVHAVSHRCQRDVHLFVLDRDVPKHSVLPYRDLSQRRDVSARPYGTMVIG